MAPQPIVTVNMAEATGTVTVNIADAKAITTFSMADIGDDSVVGHFAGGYIEGSSTLDIPSLREILL